VILIVLGIVMVKRDFLATFRVDKDSWVLFQQWCKDKDISASLALCKFVERAGKGLVTIDSDDLDVDQSESLEERLAQIEERLSKLEGK
jgi:hypothetical protein